MTVVVLYGANQVYMDVTKRALKCCHNEHLILPGDDGLRAQKLGDPMVGVVKEVIVKVMRYDKEEEVYRFPALTPIHLHLPGVASIPLDPKGWKNQSFAVYAEKLQYLHDNLKFEGNIKDEYPEQLLSVEFIKPHQKVLEIGSNIGRNTLVIASLLDDDHNLVTMECNPEYVVQLAKHRDANHFSFQIENSALSAFPLFLKGWHTFYEFNKPPGATEIKTISWDKLQKKYGIDFDTLVVDCEGSLYYILGETPELLDKITMIIMENDYHEIAHKQEVDKIIKSRGFILKKNVQGGFGPCYHMFYQVWCK